MFRISDTIRRTETVDGGILLDIHHGQMFCLNVVGAKILELMQRGYDETRSAEEISRDYGASKEVVRTDVLNVIRDSACWVLGSHGSGRTGMLLFLFFFLGYLMASRGSRIERHFLLNSTTATSESLLSPLSVMSFE